MSNTTYQMLELSKDKATELCDSGWWGGLSARQIAGFQLFADRLCMPFSVFHEAVEEVLFRSVWTHEFGLNPDGLRMEFLGHKSAPTMDEIMELIPAEKRIIVRMGSRDE